MATENKGANEANPFESIMSVNPEAFKESYTKFAESLSTLAEFNKSSLEAMMTSTSAFTKGMQEISSAQTEFVKSSYESGIAAAKSVAGAKSPQEAFDVQSEFARDAIEKNLGQASKVAQMWTETSKQAVAPLTERYSELVSKIQSFRP